MKKSLQDEFQPKASVADARIANVHNELRPSHFINLCSQTPASPKSTKNEGFEKPGGAIEHSNKATKRTLFPEEPEDQKK
ncbi:hypothetical protein Tco_0360395 [Tanacetum coccineum]